MRGRTERPVLRHREGGGQGLQGARQLLSVASGGATLYFSAAAASCIANGSELTRAKIGMHLGFALRARTGHSGHTLCPCTRAAHSGHTLRTHSLGAHTPGTRSVHILGPLTLATHSGHVLQPCTPRAHSGHTHTRGTHIQGIHSGHALGTCTRRVLSDQEAARQGLDCEGNASDRRFLLRGSSLARSRRASSNLGPVCLQWMPRGCAPSVQCVSRVRGRSEQPECVDRVHAPSGCPECGWSAWPECLPGLCGRSA